MRDEERDKRDAEQRRDRRHHLGQAKALEEDPLRQRDEMGERVHRAQQAQCGRHVLDRGEIARQHHRGHHEAEHAQKGLLLARTDRRDQQPHAGERKRIGEHRQQQHPQLPGEGHAVKEDRRRGDHAGLHHRYQNARHRLADHDVARRQRRDEELVIGALLALACQRQRGDQQAADGRDDRDQAGQHEPLVVQVRVVEVAPLDPCGQALARALVGEGRGDVADVGKGDLRRVRLAPVDQRLQRDRGARQHLAREVGRDAQAQKRLLPVDRLFQFGLAVHRIKRAEGRGGGDAVHQLDRLGARILVQDRDGGIAHLERGGEGKDGKLHQKRHHQHRHIAARGQQLRQLFRDQGEDAAPHRQPSSRMRVRRAVRPSQNSAETSRNSRFGSRIAAMSPAWNRVCITVTK
ncbi:hypothetical protein SDC9_31478 [bioreactor metagenome]|uniref:Uncharacterized protein n=1 Tax=bioreactor metagenome TaxID=1076179 RepID=A0A644V2F2_9ZZZZ